MTIVLLNENWYAVKTIYSGDSEFFAFEKDKTNSSGASWTAKLKINSQYLNILGKSHFYILIVANCQGTNGTYENVLFNNISWMMPLSETIVHPNSNGNRKTFSITNAFWSPQGNDNSCIPMCGMQRIEIPSDWESYYDEDNAFMIESVPMMRSMIKLRIVDNTAKSENASDSYRIKSVSISDYNTRGMLVPGDDKFETGMSDWKEIVSNNEQRILETASCAYNYGKWKSNETIVIPKSEFTDKSNNKYNAFIAYLPESKVKDPLESPKISITTVHEFYQKDENGEFILDSKCNKIIETEFEKTWDDIDIRTLFSDIYGKNNIPSMVRNHIYEFKIEISEKNSIQAIYQVCPWQTGEATIFFN